MKRIISTLLRAPAGARPFSPTQIAGLTMWLKCDAGITLVSSEVDVWADQSGNGNNATAVSSLLRPDYSTTLNGKTVLSFANNANMTLTSSVANTLTAAGNYSLFIVSRSTNTGAIQYIMSGVINTNNRFALGLTATNLPSFTYRNGASGTGKSFVAGTTTSWNIQTCKLSPHTYYVGTTAATSTSTVNNADPGSVRAYLGSNTNAANLMTGDVAEIVLYNSLLSAADELKVYNYLKAKYAL